MFTSFWLELCHITIQVASETGKHKSLYNRAPLSGIQTFDPIPLLFSFWDLYNVDVAAQRSLKLFAFFFVCLFFLFPFFLICLSFCCCDWVIFFILPSG